MASKRPVAWADTLLNVALPSATLMVPVDLLATLTPSDTITVVRTIGHLYIITDSFSATNDGILGIDLGIGSTSEEAFDAAVVPDPQTAGDVPARGWLWRDRVVYARANASGTVEDFHIPEIKFDIRSSRKVDRGKHYIVGFNSVLDGTGFNVRLMGLVRSLCMT